MAKEQFSGDVELKNIDLANFAHAAVSLARSDIPKMEKEGIDPEFQKLVKKARKYLGLVLDQAISAYEHK